MVQMLEYPPAERTDKVDEFHGVEVADPYGWLGADDERARRWLTAELRLSATVLNGLADRGRIESMADRLPTEVPPRLPVRRGAYVFTFPKADNGGVRVVRRGPQGEAAFDPVVLKDLASGRLSAEFAYVSPSGRFVAAGLNDPGTDWHRVVVWDLELGRLAAGPFAETAHPVVAWAPDERRLYRNVTRERFGLHGIRDGVWVDHIGAQPTDGRLVFELGDGFGHAALPIITRDGTLLVKIMDFVSQEAALWRVNSTGDAQALLEPGLRFNLVGEAGDAILIETHRGAERGRVVALDVRGRSDELHVVVPEQPDAALAIAAHSTWSPSACLCGRRLLLTYVRDAAHQVLAFDVDGSAHDKIALPGPSTVLGLQATHGGAEIAVTDFLSPWTHLSVDPVSLDVKITDRVGSNLPIEGASSSCIFCESDDGTRVPAFVVRPDKPPGPLPTLLYVYGGWGQSITPSFHSDLALWLALGGAYAVAVTRGGGEYGEAWRIAGTGLNKVNTFDDCCAVAASLIDRGIAARDGLCIRGLSNGGLVTAACVNRRPDLFVAASCLIPLVDVVHLLELPAGALFTKEFGDPTSDRTTFDYMLGYSPLQNVRRDADRPDVLVTVGEKDERVPSQWAYRYVAALQATAAPGQTVILKVLTGEAHGGWPPAVDREILVDQTAFLWSRAKGPRERSGESQ